MRPCRGVTLGKEVGGHVEALLDQDEGGPGLLEFLHGLEFGPIGQITAHIQRRRTGVAVTRAEAISSAVAVAQRCIAGDRAS